RDFIPNVLDHLPSIIQARFPIRNITKEAFPILGTNGHEIRFGLGIIVSMQPDRSAMMNFWVKSHTSDPPTISFSIAASWAACRNTA
ncbi:MAG: hypothetical protein R6V39_08230, partial [Desulfovibrionales bacterium]